MSEKVEKMDQCFCNRLYRSCAPVKITEFAFSGSLCRICEFKTVDGLRYCLKIFSLSNYKHLHFPHFEYKWIIGKLHALQSTQTIFPTAYNSDGVLTIKQQQQPFINDFKIKFGTHCLTIGPVTAFGLVKTAPFTDFSNIGANFTCDPKWDICACKRCSVFKRLIEYESSALKEFQHRRPENVILFRR